MYETSTIQLKNTASLQLVTCCKNTVSTPEKSTLKDREAKEVYKSSPAVLDTPFLFGLDSKAVFICCLMFDVHVELFFLHPILPL